MPLVKANQTTSSFKEGDIFVAIQDKANKNGWRLEGVTGWHYKYRFEILDDDSNIEVNLAKHLYENFGREDDQSQSMVGKCIGNVDYVPRVGQVYIGHRTGKEREIIRIEGDRVWNKDGITWTVPAQIGSTSKVIADPNAPGEQKWEDLSEFDQHVWQEYAREILEEVI